MTRLRALVIALFAALLSVHASSQTGTLINREIHSDNLTHNLIGVEPTRKLTIYLPPGYADSRQRYPVIYYLPNPLGDFDATFTQQHTEQLFDYAIATDRIGKFILVSVDMSTPFGPTWYINSPITGNWDDFFIHDVIPYIDANFRTLATRNSRGIFGNFFGGYGAIRFGMVHPEMFSVIYATHPVGTGSGVQQMVSRPNWTIIANAKSLNDVKRDGFSGLFTGIFQAFLPDANNAPLFFDPPAHLVNGRVVIDATQMARLRENWFLDNLVAKYADNLKKLRGLKYDWPRNDNIYDHVYGAQALTLKFNEFGVPHEAEEFNGTWDEDSTGHTKYADNRVYNEVLPFFGARLDF